MSGYTNPGAFLIPEVPANGWLTIGFQRENLVMLAILFNHMFMGGSMNNEVFVGNESMNQEAMIYEKPSVDALDMASEILGVGGSNLDAVTFTQP